MKLTQFFMAEYPRSTYPLIRQIRVRKSKPIPPLERQRFERKAKPCSAEAAPTGQPASAKVVDFVSDPAPKNLPKQIT